MVDAIATRDVEHGLRTTFEANLSSRYAARVPGAMEIYRRRALAVKVPVPVVLIPVAIVELFDGAGHLFWWEDPDRAAALLAALGRGG